MRSHFKTLPTGMAIVLCIATPLHAATHTMERAENGATDATLAKLWTLDERVWTIGHRLTVRASTLCPGEYVTGFTIQSPTQYAPAFREAAARVLKVADRPSVGIVPTGSGAERAGLQRGDIVVAIDGVALRVDPPSKTATFAEVERLEAESDRAAQDGTIVLDMVRGEAARQVTVIPDRGCPIRFDVRAGGASDASANGRYVQVGSDLVESLSEDGDLAALLAHEIAHNVLGHAKVLATVRGGLLAGFGKSGRTIRATEVAADRLSLYILALAGYPLEPAIAFWDRFTRANDWGIFSDRTHPGPAERVRVLRAEAARIEALRAAGKEVLPPDDLLRSTDTSDRRPPAR